MLLKKLYHVLLSMLPKKQRILVSYFRIYKVLPNINHPTSINEKIIKRIICEQDKNFAFYADKYAVRDYIEEKIGSMYLVPLVAMYENAEDLNKLYNWNKIVIKPNHGAGMVEVIDNEPSLQEKNKIISQAKKWLEVDFSKVSDEWHYSLISPKIVIEEKITEKGVDLKDYKFHRFLQKNGTYKQILQVVAERSSNDFETVFFDVDDLNTILHSPFGYILELTDSEKNEIKKITELNLNICEQYSYVRLDWYITTDNIYFGEITFTPGAGRSRSFEGEFGKYMGGLWQS